MLRKVRMERKFKNEYEDAGVSVDETIGDSFDCCSNQKSFEFKTQEGQLEQDMLQTSAK